MLQVGVGKSDGVDAHVVGVEAAQEALKEFGVQRVDLVVVFASVTYQQKEVLRGVRSVTGEALLIGSSTAGEITTLGSAKRHSVVVMVISSDTIKFYADIGEGIAENPAAAGRQVADRVKEKSDGSLRLFMLFSDVLVGDGAALVRGTLESLGKHFPVVGGASGDDFEFERSYQYFNDAVYSGIVVGLGFEGNFKFGIGVKHGWAPVGLPLTVTRSEGTVVHEIDNKPAINVYEEHLGKENILELRSTKLAKIAAAYPLGVEVEGSDELLIRFPLSMDKNGAITCTAEIKKGSVVRLMVGSRETAIKVAREAAIRSVEQLEGAEPKAAFIFDSMTRGQIFGDKAGDEISAIQESIGSTVPLIGFYAYGEIAPLDGEVLNVEKCNSVFHNESVAILVLGE